MNPSRREFVRWVGGASLMAALTSCEQLQTLGLEPATPPDTGSWRAPDGVDRDLVSHVIARVSYGPRPDDYGRIRDMGVDAYFDEQLAPETIEDRYCDSLIRRLESLDQPVGELFEYKPEFLLEEMTRAKLLRAIYSRKQLYEVMVDFWTDHFNIDSSKGDCHWLKAADDRDVIRRHALGTFPELLRASALSPAMLWYLDGRANRKALGTAKPNENYARELLELHTLGIDGGYTQGDVMEIARCLTGWTVRSRQSFYNGAVEFHADQHDDGEKRVLGHAIPAGLGEHDFDEVLRLVTRHPATAKHVATKLCRRFVSDAPPDRCVTAVAKTFTESNGDIKSTLRALLTSEDFRSARESKMKRPFHYMVSAMRAVGAETDAGPAIHEYLLRMGHAPFQYPTPDGYPEQAAPWMGSLMWRWHFARALADNRLPGVRFDAKRFAIRIGGDEALMAHLLSRKATDDERRAYYAANGDVALLLAAPGFQRA